MAKEQNNPVDPAHKMIPAPHSQQIWRHAASLMKDEFGFGLMTVLMSIDPLGLMHRTYSSLSGTYKANTHKDLRGTLWAEHVLIKGQPLQCQTRVEIKEYFPDCDKIFEFGFGAVMNLPVRVSGQTLGCFNLLDNSDSYTEAQLPIALRLAQAFAPAFQQWHFFFEESHA